MWDSINEKWVDSAKTRGIFRVGLGIPQWYQHWTYDNVANGWKVHTIDSIVYDSAANPKYIFTKVNHRGILLDSSFRIIKREADTVNNIHYVFSNGKWIVDSIVIMHFNYNGLWSKFIKVYDPITQLFKTGVKINFANPYFEKIIYADIEEGINDDEVLHLYPNPTTSAFNLEYTLNEADNVDINIYDITGRQLKHIFHSGQNPGKHLEQIDIHDFPTGIYLVKMQMNNMTKEVKLIKIQN